MTDLEQKKSTKEFAERSKDKGYEKGELQRYWLDLLSNVLANSEDEKLTNQIKYFLDNER